MLNRLQHRADTLLRIQTYESGDSAHNLRGGTRILRVTHGRDARATLFESVCSIRPLTHSARASQVPLRTAFWRAQERSVPCSCNASSINCRNSSLLRAIRSTSLIVSYSGRGEMTTGLPVARYSRTLIAEP